MMLGLWVSCSRVFSCLMVVCLASWSLLLIPNEKKKTIFVMGLGGMAGSRVAVQLDSVLGCG